jgi:hypothetical protein
MFPLGRRHVAFVGGAPTPPPPLFGANDVAAAAKVGRAVPDAGSSQRDSFGFVVT